MTVSGKGRDQLSPMEAIMMQEQIYQARVESNDSLDNGLEMSLQLTYIKVSSPEIACQLGSYADRFTLSCGKYIPVSAKRSIDFHHTNLNCISTVSDFVVGH
ncbi:hypothetical protein DPMN_095142 [Dreissena polymorpha]|uniref:Uncharacterized protein n=1 Tax=Dreissena polymorpha TaxID=45954 RepID=A0A9D4R2K6_DREPO|nr:hypothetical protein DPMN_095142 [Dreissena polymorpha]